jgi:hypothetical protein
VLDRVGDVGPRPVDPGLGQRVVEHPAGGPDERGAGEVLLVARLLADEHHLGAGRPLAEDHLGGVAVEVAGGAGRRCGSELVEVHGATFSLHGEVYRLPTSR